MAKALIVLGITFTVSGIAILFDCLFLNASTMASFAIRSITKNPSNKSDLQLQLYHPYFHRDHFESNHSEFGVYSVEIGKIIASEMNDTVVDEWSAKLHHDLLYLPFGANHKSRSNLSVTTKQMYDEYFGRLQRSRQKHAHGERNFGSADFEIDFFEFIQYNGMQSNEANVCNVSFYNLFLIENAIDDSLYVSPSKRRYRHIDDWHFVPKLYTYTLSIDSDGFLPSLQFRFGEITDEYQHDIMKHVLLNRNEAHCLWAGEFYYVYDYKYRTYVLMMDNASGHYKPDRDRIPSYLEWMLYKALFPRFNMSKLTTSEAKYAYVDFYRPLVMVGHDDYPWHDIKKLLFPVLHDINDLLKQRRQERKKRMGEQQFKMLQFRAKLRKKQLRRREKKNQKKRT